MKVFLSSTCHDLTEHRHAATAALERLGQQVGRMEIFGARPEEPAAACIAEIERCDVVVGVYAHRYGFIPGGSRRSITEQEFEAARELGKPLFCYLVDETYPWPETQVEGEPARTRLHAFKERIRQAVVTETFREPLDLAVKLATSVGHYLITHPSTRRVAPSDAEAGRKRQELITLLESRKRGIFADYELSATQQRELTELHAMNVNAIREGELLLSHLLTNQVHLLLCETRPRVRGTRIHGDGPLPAYCVHIPHPSDFESNYPFARQPLTHRLDWYGIGPAPLVYRRPPEGILGRWGGRRRYEEALLRAWLPAAAGQLEEALKQEREHRRRLDEADARGVMDGRPGNDGWFHCPACGDSFHPVRVPRGWDGRRCGRCSTRLRLRFAREGWEDERVCTSRAGDAYRVWLAGPKHGHRNPGPDARPLCFETVDGQWVGWVLASPPVPPGEIAAETLERYLAQAKRRG